MKKAVLFDLDGVLIETEKETFRFYQDYFKDKGIIIKDEDFKFKAGRKSVDFFSAILSPEQLQQFNTKEITDLKRELFNTNLDKYVKKVPGGKELLQTLKETGIPMALGSQNESRMINSVLEWLDVRPYFECVLSLDDITKKKPDPEIYLLAASKMSAKPEDCLVIEDSRDGIAAAKNAGMYCVALWHDYMPDDNYKNADAVIKELGELPQHLEK